MVNRDDYVIGHALTEIRAGLLVLKGSEKEPDLVVKMLEEIFGLKVRVEHA